jgi:hypothetical protein
VLDASTMRFSREQLPKASRNGRPLSRKRQLGRERHDGSGSDQLALSFDTAPAATAVDDPPAAQDEAPAKETVEPSTVASPLRSVNRVAGRCEKCGVRVEPGTGVQQRLGSRTVVCCHPACDRDGD